jgi:hypothetical protein
MGTRGGVQARLFQLMPSCPSWPGLHMLMLGGVTHGWAEGGRVQHWPGEGCLEGGRRPTCACPTLVTVGIQRQHGAVGEEARVAVPWTLIRRQQLTVHMCMDCSASCRRSCWHYPMWQITVASTHTCACEQALSCTSQQCRSPSESCLFFCLSTTQLRLADDTCLLHQADPRPSRAWLEGL